MILISGDLKRADKTGRRRGAALEAAILDAAWTELTENGYAGLTLEAVARRAGTSRPVMHRRWPSRIRLAVAAMQRHTMLHPLTVPDLGSVREETRLLLRLLSDRARPDLLRLLFDMQSDLAESRSSLADLKDEVGEPGLVQAILARGVARGEVDARRFTPRIVSLPTDLARHEMLMTFEPLAEEAIAEIVDQIFLPLVSAQNR